MNQRRSGLAMLLVLALILTVGATSATAFRYLAAAARSEHRIEEQDIYDTGALAVAARGLSLLETGQPPSIPYSCKTTAVVHGDVAYFRLTYSSDVAGEWQLDVIPTNASDTAPTMPTSFASIFP